MIIPVSTEDKEFFNNYIYCANSLLKLKERERQVLSILLMIYYANKDKETIDKLLFKAEVKKKIRHYMKPEMSEASYNNHLVQLRIKKILSNDNKINHKLVENCFNDYEEFKEKGSTVVSYKIEKSKVKS